MTAGELRGLLAAFPDDAGVFMVYENETGTGVDFVTGIADGSQRQDRSAVYIYGETDE